MSRICAALEELTLRSLWTKNRREHLDKK